MVNELRKDYLLERWVVIAGNRGKRPSDFVRKTQTDSNEKTCFFCPGNESMTPPEICKLPAKGKKWDIRVFPNKFPAVIPDDGDFSTGLLTSQPAYGHHEVIVETPIHGNSLRDLKPKQMIDFIKVINSRIVDLESKKLVEYVNVFKNHGKVSGASLTHSHSQIITTPKIPPLVEKEIEASKKYFKDHDKCVFCEIVKKEGKSMRKITENNDFLCFAPYASRFPFESWIAPKKHITRLDELKKTEINSMAKIMIDVLKRYDTCLKDPSYNLMLHYSPKSENLHLHWEIAPRLATWAGFELGSEVVINIMPPEDAAGHLRSV